MQIKSITQKLVLTIVVPLVIILLSLGILNFFETKKIIDQLVQAEQAYIHNEIKSFMELQFVALDIIEEPIQHQMQNYSEQLVNNYYTSIETIEKTNLNHIREKLGMNPELYDLYVINRDGIIVNTTYSKDLGINMYSFGDVHKQYLLQLFESGNFDSPKFFFENQTKKYKKYSYQATPDKKYIIEIGLYSNQADRIFSHTLEHLQNIKKQRSSLSDADLFFYLDKPTSLNPDIAFFEDHLSLLDQIETQNSVSAKLNADGKTYSYIYVKNKNSKLIKGAIVRLAHKPEILNNYTQREKLKFIAVFVILVVLIAIISILIRPIGKAIKSTAATAKELAIGNLSVTIAARLKNRNDELGDLAKAIEKLITSLLHTADFARETGKENFNEKYELLSDKDVLGKTLVTMQSRLTQAKKEKDIAAREESENKYIAEGLTKFSETLRSNNNDISQLAKQLMQKLTDYLEIPVGALFVIEHDENNTEYLDLKATVGYGRQKLIRTKLKIGESLAGRCAFEKLPIHLKEIPDNYITIKSGLGGANPKFIILTPLIFNDVIYGVIELASFDELESYKLTFVEQLAESIASTLSVVKTNQRTIKLLEQSKQQKEELAAQEQEMRQNMEELMEDLEKLQHSESMLTEKIQKLHGRVYFVEYTVDGKIIDASDSYLKLLNQSLESFSNKTYIDEAQLVNLNKNDLVENFKLKKSFEQSCMVEILEQTLELKHIYYFMGTEKAFFKIAFPFKN